MLICVCLHIQGYAYYVYTLRGIVALRLFGYLCVCVCECVFVCLLKYTFVYMCVYVWHVCICTFWEYTQNLIGGLL